jgi:2-hydroxychromene-2-carboxylate isomerase
MTKTIEFLFDVGSPFSWLAYHRLPSFAKEHGADIIWTPVLVAGIFQATGNRSPVEVPLKAHYTLLDLQRWAKAFDVQFEMNPNFPIHTLQLMRVATALQMQDEAAFQRYLAAIFHAMFEKPRNLSDPAEVASVLAQAGFDPMQLLAMSGEQAVKDKLKENTTNAVARGAFGVPTFFVGEQMFWGQDRLDFVAQALAQA